MGTQQFSETMPLIDPFIFDNSSGIGQQYFGNATHRETRVDAILVGQNDTIDHVFNLFFDVAGLTVPLGSVNIPAGSGYLGLPMIDVLAAILPVGSAGLALPSGTDFLASLDVAMTGSSTLSVLQLGGTL